MFAANKKISTRQLTRQIITENIGMVCILSGHLAAVCGSVWYVFIYPVLMCLSYGYLWIVIKKIRASVDKKYKKSVAINLMFILRFATMGAFGAYVFYSLLKDLLLKGNYWWVVIIAVGALCHYVSIREAEERGRLHEILIYCVMIPILLILISSTLKVEFETGEFHFSKRLIFATVLLFFSGTYFENLFIYDYHFEDDVKFKMASIKIPVVLFGVGAAVYVLCALLFGKNASLLKLMDVGGVPGGFFNRQEAIMAVFIVISLTSYVSGMFYTVRQCVKNIFVRRAQVERKKASLFIYGLLFLIMLFSGIAVERISGKKSENMMKQSFSGANDIENYDFVMSICVSDNEKIIIEVDDEYLEYKTYDIDKLCKMHVEEGRKVLNFSHVKGILFNNVKEKEENKLLDKLEKDERFSGNIFVLESSKESENLYRMMEEKKKSYKLGSALENLGDNVEKYKSSRLYKEGR